MAYPQPGLFVQGMTSHCHLEFRLREGASSVDVIEAVRQARSAASWLNGPNVTWGFAPNLWSELNPGDLPADAHSFQRIDGVDGYFAPATQFDVWTWCSGASQEAVDRSAALIRAALGGVGDVAMRVEAYTTPDSRDPTGFIDGTENPLLDEAQEVTLYPDGGPGAGGTSALIQKWVHNLAAFEALSVTAQEDVIGRTKPDSTQLDDDVMPATSHVSRNTVVDSSGEERHIYRRNTPFAMGSETGTQFIGLTNDTGLMQDMLDRMFGVAEDGLIDTLIEFSTPVTGSWYFVPSMQELAAVFGPIAEEDEDDTDAPGPDTTLGIGSLRALAVEASQNLPGV